MKLEQSCRKKKRIAHKPFSMRFRFLTTIIIAMFAVTICIGGLCIYEVDQYIQVQAQEFVNITCSNESAKINDSLGNMEKSVKIMESYLMDFIESAADIKDPVFQEQLIQNAEHMFYDVIKHTSNSGAIAYYFRLNPEISHSKAGLFYSKLNGGNEFIAFDPTDISLYEKDDVEHVGWFWQPYEAGEPIWMEPYHNQNNDILMISYVIPMYYEGTFIGVVGMDFDYIVLAEQVHELQIYDNGFAYLENDGIVVCSGEHDFDLSTIASSPDYLRVSQSLVNGMTLTLSASFDDIRQIRYDITLKIILAASILFVVFTLIAFVVVKRIVDPLKKLTDASVRLSGGDYSVEFERSNTYELDLLSEEFEDMAKRLYERESLLVRSANFDSLTGLQNMTSYRSWITEFAEQLEQTRSDFGVVMLDLNNLKETNDEYGHEVGNALIITSAKIIADVFRESPTFRMGGDEFLVILQGDELAQHETLLARLEKTCAETFVDEDAQIPVSIAVGFARFDPSIDTCFKDVTRRADAAMYENKRNSKNENSVCKV